MAERGEHRTGALGLGGWLFVGAVIVAGACFAAAAWLLAPPARSTWPALLYIGIYTQIAALLPIRWSRGSLQHVFTAPLVAAGLLSPGAGVAAVAWVAIYDRRLPGRDVPLWRLVFVRATTALTHGIGSVLAATVVLPEPWSLPFRTLIYSLAVICINLPLTAGVFAAMNRTSVVREIVENAGVSTIRSILILGFAGGILFLILQQPVGYLMAPALGGLLLAVRANMADLQKQSQMRMQTLLLAGQALDARDSYTESHSTRVADFAAHLASALKLPPRDVESVRSAGLLHDIGKIGIPDAILHKPGRLSDEERLVMNGHAALGADMISRHEALAHLAPMVRHHHERWDGSGYPDGLVAARIPLGARILAVADSFDTMTGLRVYKASKMSPEQAIHEMRGLSGRWYDPAVVTAAAMLVLPDERLAASEMEPPAKTRRLAALIGGMSISALGDPMTTVALLVTIFATTHSSLLVGFTYVLRAVATILTTGLAGSIGDRWSRRTVIAVADITRAGIVAAMPAAIAALGVSAVFVAVFLLAVGNAVVSPARQASLPELVPEERLTKALGLASSTTTLAQVFGFGLAGLLLTVGMNVRLLLYVDAATFALAAVALVATGPLGGGLRAIRFSAALTASHRLLAARPFFAITAAAGVGIGASYPTLVPLGYTLSRNGAGAYTLLEVCLAIGVAVGSYASHRLLVGGGLRTSLYGLMLMGAASVGLGLAGQLLPALVFMAIASIGSAVYLVANQEGLLRIAPPEHRSGVMSSRFAVAQTAILIGTAIGGLTTSAIGPGATYSLLGAYLVVVAVVFHMLRVSTDAGVAADGAEPAPS